MQAIEDEAGNVTGYVGFNDFGEPKQFTTPPLKKGQKIKPKKGNRPDDISKILDSVNGRIAKRIKEGANQEQINRIIDNTKKQYPWMADFKLEETKIPTGKRNLKTLEEETKPGYILVPPEEAMPAEEPVPQEPTAPQSTRQFTPQEIEAEMRRRGKIK